MELDFNTIVDNLVDDYDYITYMRAIRIGEGENKEEIDLEEALYLAGTYSYHIYNLSLLEQYENCVRLRTLLTEALLEYTTEDRAIELIKCCIEANNNIENE